MKGFIEVAENKLKKRESTVCININNICVFYEIHDQVNKKYRTMIVLQKQNHNYLDCVDADEPYEEIKQKIKEAQGEK